MFSRFVKSKQFVIVLSLLLALGLWLFVVGDTIFQTAPKRKVIEGISLVHINLDEKYRITEFSGNVTVVLEGLPDELRDINANDLIAFVDLRDKEPGEHTPDIKVNPPEGLKVVSYLPMTARVTIALK